MNWLDLVTSIISRVPIERALFSPRDNTKALEDFIDKQNKISEGKSPSTTIQEPPKPPEIEPQSRTAGPAVTTEETPATAPENQKVAETITEKEKASSIAAGCVPCAMNHFSTCSGLLNEAVRFGRTDGIESGEVIDRVGMCMDELNALERVDLRPELIANLPEWEKSLAEKALLESRQMRHNLEGLANAKDLEKVAASTQTARKEIGRSWFKERLARMPKEEKEKLAEKAIAKLEEV